MNAIAMRARPHRGCRVLLGGALIVCSLTTGCQQPYYHAPYQPGMYQPQPYGGQPYGAQPYGGATYGTPQGQFVSPPGVSSVPADTFHTPAPSNNSTNGGDAPSFSNPGNSGGNSQNGVPKYNDPSSDSPYFEQNSMRQDPAANPMAAMAHNSPRTSAAPQDPAGGFVPQDTSVAAAGFHQPQNSDNAIDLTGEETFQQFEPPMTANSSGAGTPPGTFDAAATTTNSPTAGTSPENLFPGAGSGEVAAAPAQTMAASEPQPMDSPFELAAPPLGEASAAPAQGNASPETAALEGTVQFQPANQRWILKFAGAETASAPFGGQLPLTGSADVLKSLKDRGQFRVHGFLEVSEDPNGESQFHVQRVENLSSPFAQ
ncbi:MAG: hypothetical protein ACE37I_03115 [Rubinisphaera brasiliensis]|uniref:hypothetical protein n=1 Tax=Rubinisphaera brasiliensis TaxID=119 RepID=UPI003918BE95